METPFGRISMPVLIYLLLPKKWQSRFLMAFLIILFPIAVWLSYAWYKGGHIHEYWKAVTGQPNYVNINAELDKAHEQSLKDKAAEAEKTRQKCREFAKNLERFNIKNCD